MLDVILQILSVLGIILLVLLCLAIVALLLILFFPVSYRITGKKDAESVFLSARADWLFGLLRLRGAYPEPGRVTIRLLWFLLYDSGAKEAEEEAEKETKKQVHRAEEQATAQPGENKDKPLAPAKSQGDAGGTAKEPKKEPKKEPEEEKTTAAKKRSEQTKADTEEENFNWFSKKIAKLKFTILSTYDKIKKIWQNISYYVNLLQEDETRLLFSHTMQRLRKVLKSIRPRKLKANVLFGTGAPDTTGYAFGIYGMFSPLLGPGVVVTPDFERAVLEGNFDAAGYITSVILFWHIVKVLLDRKLWRFFDRLKKESNPVESSDSQSSGGEMEQKNKKKSASGKKKRKRKAQKK